MLPKGIRQADLNELLDITEQIAALKRRQSEVRDKVDRAFMYAEDIQVKYGEVGLAFGHADYFDTEEFAKAFPPEKFPIYYEPAVDADSVPKAIKARFLKRVKRLSVKRIVTQPAVRRHLTVV